MSSKNLKRDFGRASYLCRYAVAGLCRSLAEIPHDKLEDLLGEWSCQFVQTGGEIKSFRRDCERMAQSLGFTEPVEPVAFFLSLQTFYLIVVKVIALQVALACTSPGAEAGLAGVASLQSDDLKVYFRDGVEQGTILHELGLHNLLESSLFSWYSHIWGGQIESVAREIVGVLSGYTLPAPGKEVKIGGDVFKGLYQQLVPRGLRHNLGEYFTPDWLAEILMDRLEIGGFSGNPRKRVLDPACGTGTFLVLAIHKVRKYARENGIPQSQTLEMILSNIVGFDLNPLAVIAARTNYLLAVSDLLPFSRGKLRIPVYVADSILSPVGREGRFDYVVGNPPWVNWENLPAESRQKTKALWEQYGLFPHGGMETILGKGKKDLSMLFTYVAADRYLKRNGRLGFVITQSVFKNAGAARGFRRFALPNGTPLRVVSVDDMVELRPFEGANNRVAVVILQKGASNRYPVIYNCWHKARQKTSLDLEPVSGETAGKFTVSSLLAEPVAVTDPVSPWITGRRRALRAVRKLLGHSDYVARTGVNSGGANGVYWVEILEEQPNGLVRIRNLTEGAKRQVQSIDTEVERCLLYPLLRGRDACRWRADSCGHIILAQDPRKRCGISEEEMAGCYPRTLDYFRHFEMVLRERAAFNRYFTRLNPGGERIETGPFYSMFDVGEYSLASYKVVWGRIASRINGSVIGKWGGKVVLPQETITMVGTEDRSEAYYLCAVVNSSPFDFAAQSYSQKGGKSFGSAHILEYLRIPKFDHSSLLHLALAAVSEQAHLLAQGGGNSGLDTLQEEIDKLAAMLWGLTASELKEIKDAFAELC